jgi:hypothetical protein
MKREIEYFNYTDDVRRAVLESRAAELERRLRDLTRGPGTLEDGACPQHPGTCQRSRAERHLVIDPAEYPEPAADEPPPELGSSADPRGPGCG